MPEEYGRFRPVLDSDPAFWEKRNMTIDAKRCAGILLDEHLSIKEKAAAVDEYMQYYNPKTCEVL